MEKAERKFVLVTIQEDKTKEMKKGPNRHIFSVFETIMV